MRARRIPPELLDGIREARTEFWARSPHRSRSAFVPLSSSTLSPWNGVPRRCTSLDAALADLDQPFMVVLAPPGGGKTALLGHHEVDLARRGLARATERITFYAALGTAGRDPIGRTSPRRWLDSVWEREHPSLPPFRDVLARGSVDLLLDGLQDVMPASDEYRWSTVVAWRAIAEQIGTDGNGNRVVITCRSGDYVAPPSTRGMAEVECIIEPLDDDAAREICLRREPRRPELWGEIQDAGFQDLVRRPGPLVALVEWSRRVRGLANDPAAAVSAVMRRALANDVSAGAAWIEQTQLLTADEVARAAREGLPRRLPGPDLTGGLEDLAVALTDRRPEDGFVTRAAAARWSGPRGREVVRAGVALGALDQDLVSRMVRFACPHVQAYFAGRALAAGRHLEVLRAALGRHDDAAREVAAVDAWRLALVMGALLARIPDDYLNTLRSVSVLAADAVAADGAVRRRVAEARAGRRGR